MADTSQNQKIIDGVVVLSEFDVDSLPTPSGDKIYLYAQDDGAGNTIIKTKRSDGSEKKIVSEADTISISVFEARSKFVASISSQQDNKLHEDFGSSLSGYTVVGSPSFGTVTLTGGEFRLIDTSAAGVLTVRPTGDQLTSTYRNYVIEAIVTLDTTQKLDFRLIDGSSTTRIGVGIDNNNTFFKTIDTTVTTNISALGFDRISGARILTVIDPVRKKATAWANYSNSGEQTEILIHNDVSYTNEIVAWQLATSLGATGTATVSRVRAYHIGGVIIGDSIAAGRTGLLPTPGIQSQDWTSSAEYWVEQSLGGKQMVVNWGDAGDQWSDVLGKTNLITKLKPDWCIINCGTNDIYNGISYDSMNANRAAVVTGLQAAGIVVVVNEVLPRNNFDADMNIAKNIWNSGLLTGSNNEGFLVARIHDPFLASGSLTNIEPAYSSDNIHPSVIGYRRMAEIIRQAH